MMAINAEVTEVTEDATEVVEVVEDPKPAKAPRKRAPRAKKVEPVEESVTEEVEAPSTEVAVVETEPAEVEEVAPLTERQAKALDKKIKAATEKFNTTTEQLFDLLEQAAAGQIHLALGYSSWTLWFAESVKIQPNDKIERKALAALMAGRGMSQRQIASTLGVSQKTVDRDLEGEDVGDVTLGSDGKEHPKTKARKESEEPEVIDAEVIEDPDAEGEVEYAPLTVGEILAGFEQETANLFQSQNELSELLREQKWDKVRKRAAEANLNTITEVIKSLQDIVDDMMTA